MTVRGRRVLLWGFPGLLLAIGLFFAFRPQTVLVDLVELRHGPLVVTVDEEGETRIRDVYILSAPVAGRALRIDAEVGDPVIANDTVIAEIEPIDPAFLDQRSEAQARADIRAAESAKMLATAEVESAQAELEFAHAELKRIRKLVRDDLISERVEPFGFTKVSALGIEEQRVNIIIDFDVPAEDMQRLGHGYRVETRIVLSETGNALKLPLTALFRHGPQWAVYVVEDGHARLRDVEVGARNDLEAGITRDLEEGERVIAYPSDRISDGTRVKAR